VNENEKYVFPPGLCDETLTQEISFQEARSENADIFFPFA